MMCVCVFTMEGGGGKNKITLYNNWEKLPVVWWESYEINDSRGLRKDTSIEIIYVW